MKNSITTLIFSLLVLFSFVACSTMQPQEIVNPPVQEIKITVEAAEPTDLTVNTEEETDDAWKEELSYITMVAGDKAYIKIFSGIGTADVKSLWNDMALIENNSCIKELDIFINSPGGQAFAGLALADIIESVQKKGFNVVAHASGIVASAAVPVLAVCEKRIAASGTIFMVHEAALWKWPGRETASDIRAQNELMGLLKERYMAKMTDNTKLTMEEWEKLEERTTWFSAEQALEWELIDEIE